MPDILERSRRGRLLELGVVVERLHNSVLVRGGFNDDIVACEECQIAIFVL